MSNRAACGNIGCSISTGIHDGLTFGTGELDDNGFWEHPCYICAREWEKKYPTDAPCWPFVEVSKPLPQLLVPAILALRDDARSKYSEFIFESVPSSYLRGKVKAYNTVLKLLNHSDDSTKNDDVA